FASPDKSLTIRHAKSPALAENLLAQTSMFTNTRNQWDGGGAYRRFPALRRVVALRLQSRQS
ncbi:hypothetical protein FS782_26105, partial [Agrobacterium vitis]|nr:hypothetical protein [Agrobacterium vitis]